MGIIGVYLFIIGCGLDQNSKDNSDILNDDQPLNNCMDQFDFNTSMQSASYFFYSVVLNGELIESDDWVAAFNGDVCVGSKQWNTSLCNNGVCEVPVMGFDNFILPEMDTPLTEGYCESGDVPTFKIYDSSEGKIYDAVIKYESGTIISALSWSNLGQNIADSLIAISGTEINCSN